MLTNPEDGAPPGSKKVARHGGLFELFAGPDNTHEHQRRFEDTQTFPRYAKRQHVCLAGCATAQSCGPHVSPEVELGTFGT